MGPDGMILVFWMLSKPTFSLLFHFHQEAFSSSSLSAIRVVSSAYLRLLIFLPATLIPACASSSPAFLMMYSAYKLNKQGDNIQPWRTPFSYLEPVCCSMSSSNCCFGTQFVDNIVLFCISLIIWAIKYIFIYLLAVGAFPFCECLLVSSTSFST